MKASGEARRTDGSPPASASVVGIKGSNVISRSSLPCLPAGKEAELQISAQDEQSRSSEDFLSSGHLSRESLGQLFGHSSGQPCDVSSAFCVGTQHSTRTPPLQSAGIPTSPQTAVRTARIRMKVFYDNASDRSTSHGIAATAPVPGRPRIRATESEGHALDELAGCQACFGTGDSWLRPPPELSPVLDRSTKATDAGWSLPDDLSSSRAARLALSRSRRPAARFRLSTSTTMRNYPASPLSGKLLPGVAWPRSSDLRGVGH